MDCFCQREMDSEWKGERKIKRPLLYFAKKMKEKVSEKVFFRPGAAGFLHRWCQHQLRGQTNSQACFFTSSPADGSGIQLLNDDHGVMVLSTEQDG